MEFNADKEKLGQLVLDRLKTNQELKTPDGIANCAWRVYNSERDRHGPKLFRGWRVWSISWTNNQLSVLVKHNTHTNIIRKIEVEIKLRGH